MCEMNQTEILRKNLSIFRKQRHLTQEQLANELGLILSGYLQMGKRAVLSGYFPAAPAGGDLRRDHR